MEERTFAYQSGCTQSEIGVRWEFVLVVILAHTYSFRFERQNNHILKYPTPDLPMAPSPHSPRHRRGPLSTSVALDSDCTHMGALCVRCAQLHRSVVSVSVECACGEGAEGV